MAILDVWMQAPNNVRLLTHEIHVWQTWEPPMSAPVENNGLL